MQSFKTGKGSNDRLVFSSSSVKPKSTRFYSLINLNKTTFARESNIRFSPDKNN